MEVLPAGFSDFRDRKYWNRFFQAFDKKNFEWYGTYGDIRHIIYRCIRSRMKYFSVDRGEMNGNVGIEASGEVHGEGINKNCLIINAGCGNSNLSYELLQDGFKNIVNIDYSDIVINKMKKKFGDKMEYVNIDMRNVEEFESLLEKLENERIKKKKIDFKIFFDKAFLDAYISCEENEEEVCKNNAKNYFSLIFKYLKKGDIFIIITLAQYYIIKEVIRNVYNEDIMLDVYPFLIKQNTSEFKYHPFLFSFYKAHKDKKKFTTNFVNLETGINNVISLWKLPNEINETRENLNIHIFKKGKRIILDIFNKNLNKCDYNVIVYDSCNDATIYNTIVILVPFGYEFHSLYSTAEGNEELASKARAKRLLLVMNSTFLIPPSGRNIEPSDHENDSARGSKVDILSAKSNIRENPSTSNAITNVITNTTSNTTIMDIYQYEKGEMKKHSEVENNQKGIYYECIKEKKKEGALRSKVKQEQSNSNNFSELRNGAYIELYENKNSVSVLLDSIKNELKNILNDLALPNSDNFPIMVLNESVKNCKIVKQKKSHYCSSIIIRDVLVTEEFLSENFHLEGKEKRIEKWQNGEKKRISNENSQQDSGKDHQEEETLRAILKNKAEKRTYFENKEIYKRQMIFSYDPLTVQSELIYTQEKKKKKNKKKTKKKNKKKNNNNTVDDASNDEEEDDEDDDKIQFQYIESASQYHINFCCSLFFVINSNHKKEETFINLCILGGGTNVLSNIIKSIFADFYLHIDIVEIDETVKSFYSLFCDEEIDINRNHTTNYIINDSYDYIRNYPQSQFYHAIFLDINNSQNSYIEMNNYKMYITCPHIKFLNKEIVLRIKNLLKSNGILVINVLTRDSIARKHISHFFKTLFTSIISIPSANKVKSEINDVLICTQEDITTEKISAFQSDLTEMIRTNYNKWFLNFDLKNFLKNVKVL
ncbi:hypothetical protein, conserved [Plasmodium gonderi]|uniref:Methyltransferase domain-containing protein n=1 Tax=Plasmodium gonderi TaxID=77519 RepID=A0A1Y1JEW0_PLAGO|nr:hypothetical protein, conserved [Plasmodium gonderi]GAW79272.1 hypothetical protein, conserved [Plasmodium gonderi]